MDADKWFWLVVFGGILLASLAGCADGDAGRLGAALADTHAPVPVIAIEPIGAAYPWDILPYAILTELSE